jgi:hypothetical protein
MASVKSDISLQIKNNLNRTATFSILGGTQDPSNGQANAKTIYEWDLTAESFANTTVVTIEASTIDNPVIINYEVQNQDGAVTDLQTVVRLLNTLNLGVFNLDGNTIWIIDDINIFGNIEVLVSLSFDINVFVQEAYNYFDPLGKTPLVDFQTQYTSVIQQAVDTIPDFVDFVESQGWSLCYPTNTSEIDLARFTAGSIFLTTDTGGVLATNEYTSGTSFNVNGFDNALLYAPDVNSFKTLQSLTFDAPLNPLVNGYLFKFLFEAPTFLSFNQNVGAFPVLDNGFQFLDPSYFPSPTTFGIHSFRMPPFGTNQLNLYGTEFPKLNIQAGNYSISASASASDIDLINVNSSIVFDTMGQDSNLVISNLIESNTSGIFVDFSSLTLIGDNQTISISSTDAIQQTFNFQSNFNTKFDYGGGISSLSGKTLVIGCSAGGTGAFIQYDDDTTPLNLRVKNIRFEESVTQNLPPIGTGGGQIGSVFGLLYTLRLNLEEQLNLLAGREMEYFNNWFFELGTQSFLSQNSADTSGAFGNILTAGTNLFVLSGQGYYGYQALIDCGFTIATPVGAIKNNVMTFTQKEGELLLVRTISALGQSDFKVTSASKNQAEVVDNSVFTAIGQEQIQYSAPALGEDNNCIFTSDPTLDCTSFYIGTNPSFSSNNCMTTFICGNGVFNAGIDMDTFNLNGLTITLPIYPSTSLGDAYGLFQRDFSGLNGNNVSSGLAIIYFRINVTQLANTLVQPYGSNALFNIAINGFIPSIPSVSFSNCEFGTDFNDTSASPSPLDLLIPVGARCNNGIEFNLCQFKYTASTFGGEIEFNINNNATLGIPTQTALLGSSRIENTTFGAFGNDTISLNTNYNGTGDTLSDLTFKDNADLVAVKLTNGATAVPLPISLNFDNNPQLNTIVFENYNLNNINILGGLPSVSRMNVNDNDLNTVDLDSIIVELDNNGLTNGNLDYSNQTGGASPSIGVSGVAYNNLIAKGWTVTGNVPI